VLENNIETLELCPAHCYSPSPVSPPAESLMCPSAKATASCACCVADVPPTTVALTGSPPPLVSRCPRFHRATTFAIHHLTLFAATGQSQALFLLFTLPQAHSTQHHQPPPKSAASSTVVPVRQATPVTEPLFICEPHHRAPKIAEAISRPPPSSTGSSLWTAASDPPSACPTPPRGPQHHVSAPQTQNRPPPTPYRAVIVVLPRLSLASMYRSPGELPVFLATPNHFPTMPRPS
jgi:hypothetical protein